MLTREQVYLLLILRARKGNVFSGLPRHLIEHISDCGQNPTSAISMALKHAAYARKEDVTALLKMLEDNACLLLEAGNVKTPGGLEVHRVTLYEFLLGAGDPDLAAMIAPYFSNIENGESERLRQLERYQPHIERALQQRPYDIKPIFDLLLDEKKTSNETLRSLLRNEPNQKSEIHEAISAFKDFHRPKQPLVTPGMHFNYATQMALYHMLYDHTMWPTLNATGGNNNFLRLDVVWRLMIGYLINFYPGIDRCITAQGLTHLYHPNGQQANPIQRHYELRNTRNDFILMDYSLHDDHARLGQRFGITIAGEVNMSSSAEAMLVKEPDIYYAIHCHAKMARLQSFLQDPSPKKSSRCVML